MATVGSVLALCALLALSALPARVVAKCSLERVAVPVTMLGARPLVHARINGTDALFIADSGAFYNLLTPAAASGLKLRLQPAFGLFVSGVGGEAQTWLTTIKSFTLLGVEFANVPFLVAGNDLGAGAVGVLGQNVFRAFGDVEYDLANGIIRLVRTKDCRNALLAYWAADPPQSYSVIEIAHATAQSPHTTGTAFLNGAKIRVMFDTGAYTSLLTLKAAKRAGVTPDSPGVMPAGTSSGVGRRTVQTWIGPFASFKLGDEEVRNTRLRFGAEAMPDVDMLIGADFFLSHHVYVANGQRKLYFTYNGGAVFDLRATGTAAAPDRSPADSSPPQGASADVPPGGPAAVAAGAGGPATAAPAQAGAAAAAPVPSGRPADQPADASGFARRGAALAARRDFARAIPDLTRACELAPTEAEYFYQRGLAYSANNQPDLALADLDRALSLKPADLSALVARAQLRVRRSEFPAAIADLANADRVALKGTQVRMHMAELYLLAGQYAAAVAQATAWIDAHGRDDVLMPAARDFRCRTRALWGQEIQQALEDCDAAVKRGPHTAAFFNSRGLVQLRRGDYDKAIADYDRALSMGSKEAWLYYGRGVARLRKGMTAAGQADIAAATALEPAIAEEAGKRGLAP